MPKLFKIHNHKNKTRTFEDENTEKYFLNESTNRSTEDIGGNKIARGLEQEALLNTDVEGELDDFIKVMQVLQSFPEVQSINIIQGSLKEFDDKKRFVYLSDGVTVIGEIKLFSGKEVNVVEIEREDKAISTLIYFVDNDESKLSKSGLILKILIDKGIWDKIQLNFKSINYLKLRHGKKDYQQRENMIFKK
ncbi:hypothetical protein [Viridibacillus arvi]|uniref:hypothetical protein n=1 Tax=Viridibacillus arvi TaxID=263475 RepID=UPI003D2CAABF